MVFQQGHERVVDRRLRAGRQFDVVQSFQCHSVVLISIHRDAVGDGSNLSFHGFPLRRRGSNDPSEQGRPRAPLGRRIRSCASQSTSTGRLAYQPRGQALEGPVARFECRPPNAGLQPCAQAGKLTHEECPMIRHSGGTTLRKVVERMPECQTFRLRDPAKNRRGCTPSDDSQENVRWPNET